MNILGIGTDIVSVKRIADLVDRHGDRFLNRCFQLEEIRYCQSKPVSMAASLAGRWAAKEAFLKALGRQVTHIPYGEIEVIRSKTGPVSLRLHGRAADALGLMGGRVCFLTISHEKDFAIATVVVSH